MKVEQLATILEHMLSAVRPEAKRYPYQEPDEKREPWVENPARDQMQQRLGEGCYRKTPMLYSDDD